MIEQQLKIHFERMGVLSVAPVRNYGLRSGSDCIHNLNTSVELKNIPELEKADSKTAIQFKEPEFQKASPSIFLLEENEYKLVFEAENETSGQITFPSLEDEDNTIIFQRLVSGKKGFYAGILKPGSYAGKSFFDVQIEDIKSLKVPFEVRSRKMDYEDHYTAMIADLCEAASSLIFEEKSPFSIDLDFKKSVRRSFYEDFMFLEYLFRPENLLTSYEHVRRNPHKKLKKHREDVPLPLVQSLGPYELVNMVSNPGNLHKTYSTPRNWPQNMQNYVPKDVSQQYDFEIIDTPENRFVKYFIGLVDGLIDEMVRYVEENKREGYAADKIYEYQEIIHEYCLDSWFDDIGEMEYFPSNSQVLQKKEGYRDILRYFLFLEVDFNLKWKGFEDIIRGYQKKLFDLYEYWCYIRLFKILSDLEGRRTEYENLFDSNEKNWAVEFKRGENSKQRFKIEIQGEIFDVELMYNRKFVRTKPPFKTCSMGSYSVELRPDYTISVKLNGRCSLIHFDAKYKYNINTTRSDADLSDMEEKEEKVYKNGDIYKMHTYKDAIPHSLGAYVLYPGEKSEILRETEFEVPSVGAFPLKPGENFDQDEKIRSFLGNVLAELAENITQNSDGKQPMTQDS
ncbi:hypothetical protein DSECCO2_400380 [anaerobic digester metagenome]